jgi:hypothetical protein
MSETKPTRRTVLRGLGTALALPFLEALAPARGVFALGGGGAPVAGALPRRMAFLFVPNGVNQDHWAPKAVGSRFDLTSILEPLAPVRDDILILSGLTHDKGRANADGAGDHARSASVFLTGAQPVKTDGARIRSGISVDQVAAQAIGSATRLRSLEIACEGGGNSGNCDSGYSCAYSHNISWASPTTPMAKEVDPRRVFDRLFGNGRPNEERQVADRRTSRRQSILDFVLEDARRLDGGLSGGDRRKLDEYLTSVREIERRAVAAGRIPTTDEVEAPDGLPATAGQSIEYEDHLRLLCDMIVLAFQTDSTRIASFMLARAGSNRNYRSIGVSDGHHDISHHQGNPEKLENIRKINRFHIEQFAYLVGRLKAIPEGDGTLLDNCMILYGSGLGDGNRHNHDHLPALVAGRGGGTIDTGRHVIVPEETPMSNLFLSMLHRVGVDEPYFGDSTGPLRQLRA